MEVSKEAFSVGEMLCATWGYDQTNATFAKVEKIAGKFVQLAEVNTVNEWVGNSMTGKAKPGEKVVKRYRRKVIPSSYGDGPMVKLFESYGYAKRWNGQPVSVSCYA